MREAYNRTGSTEAAVVEGIGRTGRLVTSTRVSDGTRTRGRLDHNQELYQLSYAHRATLNLAAGRHPAIIGP